MIILKYYSDGNGLCLFSARDEAPELKRAWTKLAAGGLGMELIKL